MKTMLRAAVFGTLTAGLTIAACSPFGGASAFHCEQDSQCSPGTCKQDEGLCVVANSECASGQSYGEHSGNLSGKCVGDGGNADAGIDAPTSCTANEKSCFNNAVETCKADGAGFDPAMREPCALTCTQSGPPVCLAASNVAVSDQLACNASTTAVALAPAAGATVTFNANDITCSPACNGGGTTTIPRAAAAPNNVYCLAGITIPSGVTITAAPNIANGITLYSQGPVVIDAAINFNGGNAAGVLDGMTNNEAPGAGGPGGFIGATAVATGNGNNGGGPSTCGGRGGVSAGGGAIAKGGGGGGGGNQAVGGTGGTAINAAATGGAGGTALVCSMPDLRPLAGGPGGGGGGDGGCGQDVQCGWPGGGGGGALHIVSRSSISGSGTLTANGGSGFGDDTTEADGGAGGGGAGGGILLEAPSVTYAGALQVNGGNGGRSRSQITGGTGATGATVTGGNGANADTVGGGTGGGGAGGRVRINANNATSANCGTTSPSPSCTTGALRTSP